VERRPATGYWTIVKALFSDREGGGSRVSLRHGVFETKEQCDMHLEGWNGFMRSFAEFFGEA